MIDIGCYIEAAIEWLTEEGAVFFDALNVGVESLLIVSNWHCTLSRFMFLFH